MQLVQRVRALGEWKAHLQRGVLPDPGEIPWPAEPLSSTLASVLSDLEMPRFCRRFPTLLNTVLNQMVGLIRVRWCRPFRIVIITQELGKTAAALQAMMQLPRLDVYLSRRSARLTCSLS